MRTAESKLRYAKSTNSRLLLGDTGFTERYLSRAKKLSSGIDQSDLELVWGKGVQIVEVDAYELARDRILAAQYDLTCKQPIKHLPHYSAVTPMVLYRKISVPANSRNPATVVIDGTTFAILWKDGSFHTDHLL